MSNNRPTIGVSGPDNGGIAAWWFTWFAIFLHGGRAIRLQPKNGLPEEELQGLVLGGGADINPENYGGTKFEDLLDKSEEPDNSRRWGRKFLTWLFFPLILLLRWLFSTKTISTNADRDRLEFALLSRAIRDEIPILGICRGAQLININSGGTLHEEIADFYTEVPQVKSVWPKKKVNVKPDSILFEITGHSTFWVNSLHHQAVDKLGENIRVVAREESGLIQAIEHTKYPFMIGVQWHPEYLPQIPLQRNIFRALVEQAAKVSNDRQ